MSDAHPAAPGDHVSRIASQRRFRSYVSLWAHPANQTLRDQRGSPHMLAEGDVLFIPEPEEREVDRPTNQRHQFRAHVPTLVVQLRLLGVDGKPRPEEVVAVTIDGAAAQFETVAPGTIQTRIEPTASQVSVQLGEEMLHFGVGFLQPIETLAGQRERLNNLGYFAGDSDDPNVLELRSAVEEFQCDQGLFVDGKVGPQTRAALVKAHGC